ncbi:MAG: hypothetical protein ABL931_22480 [Usitatibacteraceae bacterium]
MKRSLPILLKYLAIVAVSCFLAFIISQTPASAAAAADYAIPGVYKIESAVATWRDNARNRDVPVRLYFPVTTATKIDAPKFPVILFSHGLGGNREGGKRWAEHWASHGYVVVAIQHPGSDESLWKDAAIRDIASKMKAGMTLTNLGLRVGDVHFVIDEVIRRTNAGETGFAHAEPKRLGMSGHSFGAQTTLAVAGQKAGAIGGQSGLDLRVTAAIAFSPNARNKKNMARQFGDITLPFFSITGSEDGSILGDDTRPQDRRMPYDFMPAGQKYLAVFDGGDHMVFGGHALGKRRPETARDVKIQEGVMAGTLAFWNAQLKQDADAKKWLEQGGYKATLGEKDVFENK